jgi:hypothetical protein
MPGKVVLSPTASECRDSLSDSTPQGEQWRRRPAVCNLPQTTNPQDHDYGIRVVEQAGQGWNGSRIMELSQISGYGLTEVQGYRWFVQSRYQRCGGPVVPQHAHGARGALTEQWLCGSAEEAEDGWERCGITEEPEPLQECQARVRFWFIAEPFFK